MRIDERVIHNEDMKAVVGDFYGTPIREVNTLEVDLREIDYTQKSIRASFGLNSVPVEILPGEVVKNNLIRRNTTKEVHDEFNNGEQLLSSKTTSAGGGNTESYSAKALYFDLDLPRVVGGWKTENKLDEFGKLLTPSEFFREAPEHLRRVLKDGVWYNYLTGEAI